MVDESEDRGFLRRWSQRKQTVTRSDEPPVEQTDPGTTDQLHTLEMDNPIAPVSSGESDLPGSTESARLATDIREPPLTDDDMAPIESLDAESDYSPFLSEGVSKELRNLALKKLFFSGKFALRDGLDDYDDDFTRFEPLGNTVTSDMKFHQRRKERERLAKLEEEQKALAESAKNDDTNSHEESDDAPDQELERQDDAGTLRRDDADQPVPSPNTDAPPLPALQLTHAEADNIEKVAGGKLQHTAIGSSDSDRGNSA